MPKEIDILKRIEQGKSVLPITWQEWLAGGASLVYVLVVFGVILIALIYLLLSLF